MSSVLVFDSDPKGVLEWDADQASVAVAGSDASVLVFDRADDSETVDAPDGPSGALVLDQVQTDVVIGDANRVTTVVEADDRPDYVVLDDEGVEVLVVSPQGPRGSRGPEGDPGAPSSVPGPQGPPGDASQYDDMPDLTLIFENHLI